MKYLLITLLVPFVLGGAACSSNDEEAAPSAPTGDDAGADASGATVSDAGSDSSSNSDAGTDSGTAESPCEIAATLATSAPDISGTKQGIASAPTAMGGTIAAGTYKLTSALMYTDGGLSPSNTNRVTLQFLEGGQWAWAYRLNQDAESENLAGGKYTTSGSTIMFTTTCKRNGAGLPPEKALGYTASNDTVVILNDNGLAGTSHVIFSSTYTKQ